jgi:hypothetical protein
MTFPDTKAALVQIRHACGHRTAAVIVRNLRVGGREDLPAGGRSPGVTRTERPPLLIRRSARVARSPAHSAGPHANGSSELVGVAVLSRSCRE